MVFVVVMVVVVLVFGIELDLFGKEALTKKRALVLM